jgi:hypothetical protein
MLVNPTVKLGSLLARRKRVRTGASLSERAGLPPRLCRE